MAPVATAPVDFKALFEKSTGLYLVFNADLYVVAVTDAFCARCMLVRENIVGLSFDRLFAGQERNPAPDAPGLLKASLERVVRLRRADTMAILRFDIPRHEREGGGFVEKYWSPRNSPILDENGEVRWIVLRVYDVTEAVLKPETAEAQRRLASNQERLVIELRRNNEELAQLDHLRAGLLKMSRLSTVTMMASALAHDVSQPLTAATNYLSALRRHRAGGASDAVQDDLVAKLTHQVERAGDIVKNLRALMAASNTVHKPEAVAEVIGEAAKLAQTLAGPSGVRLTLDIATGLPPVAMDRIQIQQLLLNLTVNAIEALEGCARREIVLSAAQIDGTVRIAVADTGPGMPSEVIQRLFEPATTTALMESGLGLAIARHIVARHKGTIAVDANRPAGTVVTVTLPAGAATSGSAH